MMKFFKFVYFLIFILYAVNLNAASLEITEIMYDLEGSDSGHEWIELYNNTGGSIDLTKYKFVESGSAHNIVHHSGETELLNGEYTVISDNPATFLTDNPNFLTSQLYDSSFSLSNSGEALAIKDENGNILSEITYDPLLGAAGDGKTLQKNNTSSWIVSLPTPGSGLNSSNEDQNTNPIINPTTNTNSSTKTQVRQIEPKMEFVFDVPKNTIVGNKIIFKTTLHGFSGERITNGLFTWNFGDGQTITQNTNQNVEHIYTFPGNYIATCSYKYGSWYGGTIIMDRVKISVIESPFIFKDLYTDPFPAIHISNNRDFEYDISNYIIKTGSGNVIIPENTFIGPKDDIVINLPAGVYTKNEIELLTPSGYKVANFSNIITNNLLSNTKNIKPINNLLLANVGNSYIDSIVPDDNLNNNLINLDNTQKYNNEKTNWTYLYLLCIIIVSSVVLIFIRFKLSNKKNSDITDDEYILQDE